MLTAVVLNTDAEVRIRCHDLEPLGPCRSFEVQTFPPAACGERLIGHEELRIAGAHFACSIWGKLQGPAPGTVIGKEWIDDDTGIAVQSFRHRGHPELEPDLEASRENVEGARQEILICGRKLECLVLRREDQLANGEWVLRSRSWLSTVVPGYVARTEWYVSKAAFSGQPIPEATLKGLHLTYGAGSEAIMQVDEVVAFDAHPSV